MFPQNTLQAARIACCFSQAPWLPDFVREMYRANFAQGLDISDLATLERCLTALGQDGKAIVAASQSPEVKEQLRAQTAEAKRLGIFGAPSFVVDGELFWGNDRLEDALDWAVRAAKPASGRLP